MIPATQTIDKYLLKSKVQSILLFKTVQEVTDIMQYIATKKKIKIRLLHPIKGDFNLLTEKLTI